MAIFLWRTVRLILVLPQILYMHRKYQDLLLTNFTASSGTSGLNVVAKDLREEALHKKLEELLD